MTIPELDLKMKKNDGDDWEKMLGRWGIPEALGLRYKLARAIEDKVRTLLEEEQKFWKDYVEVAETNLKQDTKSQCADELEELVRNDITLHAYDKSDVDNLIKKWRENNEHKE